MSAPEGSGRGGAFSQASYQQPDVKERFHRYFQDEVAELQEQMGRLEDHAVVGGERQDALGHCTAGIARLSTEVADASEFIAAYDQRIYAEGIKSLSEQLDETRARIVPKTKFKFKTSNKNNSAVSLKDAAELAARQCLQPPGFLPGFSSSNESSMATTPLKITSPPGEADERYTPGDLPSSSKAYNSSTAPASTQSSQGAGPSQAAIANISSHKDRHIILPSSASRGSSSGSVTNISGCIVDMSAPTSQDNPFAGLALKNIKKSLIIVGHVAGPAHITAVENSILVVASRQVRMHDCKNVDIYLHCASRPIIEDCTNIRFSPIPACHTVASDESIQNQWDQVDDFKWLKLEPSPNWSILPDEQILKEDIWTKVIPGGPGVGLDDILKKVGITKK